MDDSEVVPNDAGKDRAGVSRVTPIVARLVERFFTHQMCKSLREASYGRVVFAVMADKPESLEKIGTAALDPAVGWNALGQLIWKEAQKQMRRG